MASVFDSNHIDNCIKLYNEGSSIRKLEKQTGTDAKLLSNILRYHGVRMRYGRNGKIAEMSIPDYGTESIDTYISMYNSGKSLVEISKECQIERHFLSYILYNKGIEGVGDVISYNHINRFMSTDNEWSAYWLGFLYADGNVATDNNRYRLVLELAEKDIQHLLKFRDWISPERPIKTRVYRDGRKSHAVYIQSVEIVSRVVDLGCIPRKSHVVRFPDNVTVPVNMLHHFMRGYFDGDGCVSGKTFSLSCGSEHFIREYVGALYTIGVSDCGISCRSQGSLYTWSKSRLSDLILIYNYLYNDATIYLGRKKSKLELIVGPHLSNKSGEVGEFGGGLTTM
jgi:hypothetical protein